MAQMYAKAKYYAIQGTLFLILLTKEKNECFIGNKKTMA